MLLNCDMGESFGNYSIGADNEVMGYVDMANIACGMHASDPDVINYTVALAARHNVTVGAHPGYPDLQGFGRRNMDMSPAEVENLVLYQVGAMKAFCSKHQAALTYIKPHGALYNTMMKKEDILKAIMQATAESGLKLMLLATSDFASHKKLGEKYGIQIILEGFVDRGYEDDGSLVNRRKKGAFLSAKEMLARVTDLCNDKPIKAINNRSLEFPIDSLCVHGDGEGVSLIKQFRSIINQHG